MWNPKSSLAVHRLSGPARRVLFGHRNEDAIPFNAEDPDWTKYESIAIDFYSETQRSGIGGVVTNQGYQILRDISLEGKVVVEIGPGSLPHRKWWRGIPSLYVSVDLRDEFHEIALTKAMCPTKKINTNFSDPRLNLPDASADMIISFYSLEHLHQLDASVREYRRILKPGGLLIGAVPNEGGLLWGIGRFLLTRPVMYLKYRVNYDKIIGWEHPNFVDEIRDSLTELLTEVSWESRPFHLLKSLNFNFVSSFIYRKDFLSSSRPRC